MVGKNILLRAPEPSDIKLLFEWENDKSIWQISNTLTPFSRFVLEQYLMNAHLDIYTTKQLRLMIDRITESHPLKTIGTIDLFDFDATHHRAGIGILICKDEQGKGYASEAIEMIIDYSDNFLQLHQLYCNIASDNTKSLNLFKKHKFEIVGLKKEWLYIHNHWKDEFMLQRIITKSDGVT
jgi:diamine N-acetyltransferase